MSINLDTDICKSPRINDSGIELDVCCHEHKPHHCDCDKVYPHLDECDKKELLDNYYTKSQIDKKLENIPLEGGNLKVSVGSGDKEIIYSPEEGKVNIGVLNNDVIEYLENICSYSYYIEEDLTNSSYYLNVEKESGCSPYIIFSSYKQRPKDNNQSVYLNITGHSSDSDIEDFNILKNGKTSLKRAYNYEKITSDLSSKKISKSISTTITNEDGTSKVISSNFNIYFKKPFLIISSPTAPDNIQDNVVYNSKNNEGGSTSPGFSSGKVSFTLENDQENPYFWIGIPNTISSINATQLGLSVLSGNAHRIQTEYGEYSFYPSKVTQIAGSSITLDLTLTHSY